ncbi:hypothetical protein FSP39_018327 [Pinctada imbricata]|uniref:Uncharacterized protein n=1 Tax=Pinctada imbricata TaxID=66713 RepID=A0AA89BS88_PINIB|nr:hypothetical protein FSP39_018327 [Pinctada imbricata]
MDPNNGHDDWKHAAIHSLRFYSCNESADALVRSFAADHDDLVREMAYKVYKDHPLSGDGHNQRHKDIIRGIRYTYRQMVRLKRSIIAAEFKDGGIYFAIKLPGIEWKKTIGLSAIGAGFGLTVKNGIEIDVRPLQGHADVDVYDEAYVKVFLGWFGLEFSIVHAFFCYQAHIRYDVNILKGGFQDIVDEIVNILKSLPVIFKTLVEDVAEAVIKALKYKAYPWITKIQTIVLKARFFIEDIKTDVLVFYNTIADAVTVTLPYGAKKIYDAISGINQGFKNFFTNPVKSIFRVGRAVLDFIIFFMKLYLFGFLRSQRKEVISSNTAPTAKYKNASCLKDLPYSPFQKDHTHEIKEALMKAFETFTSLIKSAFDRLGKPFFDAFRSVMEAVRGIKMAFVNLKDIVNKAKSLVEKVFGPKFHMDFPARRRNEVPECGQGIWPTTSNGKYSTLGVDVEIELGENVVCPVNGIVRRNGDGKVIIEPKDDDFLDLEVVIDNINPRSDIDEEGIYLRAGEDHIGTAGSSPCQPNFIHLAVRQEYILFIFVLSISFFCFDVFSTTTNILDVVNVNIYTVAQIRDIVDQGLQAKLDQIYAELQDIQASSPTEHLQGLSLAKLRQMLRFSFDKITGSQSQLISRVLGMAENGCPQFKGHLTKGEGHVCFAHPDCQGLMCGISVPYGGYHEMFQVDIRIDPCTHSLNVSAPNHETFTVHLFLEDSAHEVRFGHMMVDGLTISLSVEGYVEVTDDTVASVSAKICAQGFESCLPDIYLITGMVFHKGERCYLDVLDVIDTLREAVLKELMDDPQKAFQVHGTEFKNKHDSCKDVAIPVPTFDFPLFAHKSLIMAGPIPIVFVVEILYYVLGYGHYPYLSTSLYDKRDNFNFSIANFPFLSSNIPSLPAYGVFISQLIRYARASTKYTDFVMRARRLSDKLLSQGYVCDRLTSSLRKFYVRYGELVIHYDVPLSRMVDDILSWTI